MSLILPLIKREIPKALVSSCRLINRVHVLPSVQKGYYRCLPTVCVPQIAKLHTISSSNVGYFSTRFRNQRTVPFSHISSKCADISTKGEDHIAAFHSSVPSQTDSPPAKVPNFVQMHREHLKSAPVPALVLGVSGLIPFVLPTLFTVATISCNSTLAFAQVAYGATILSFLGGVRWGLTLTESEEAKPNWINLGYSVTPSLIAWVGLLMPLQTSIACVTSGLLLAAVVDGRMKGYPVWFKSLRVLLTTFAVLSLGVMYGYSLVFPDEKAESSLNWYKLIRIAKIIVED